MKAKAPRNIAMVRVYFVFEDPLDSSGVNLSYADVPTRKPTIAVDRVKQAAESGELWKRMYPGDEEHPYRLLDQKMVYLEISSLRDEATAETILPL
jgi:hypothetical protein